MLHLFASRLAYNHYAIAHAYNAANTHAQGSGLGALKPKSYSLVEGNRSIGPVLWFPTKWTFQDSGVNICRSLRDVVQEVPISNPFCLHTGFLSLLFHMKIYIPSLLLSEFGICWQVHTITSRGYSTPVPYFWRLCAFSQKIKQLWTKYPMNLVRNVPRN